MRATSEPVENNKVKLSIVVDEADIETADLGAVEFVPAPGTTVLFR